MRLGQGARLAPTALAGLMILGTTVALAGCEVPIRGWPPPTSTPARSAEGTQPAGTAVRQEPGPGEERGGGAATGQTTSPVRAGSQPEPGTTSTAVAAAGRISVTAPAALPSERQGALTTEPYPSPAVADMLSPAEARRAVELTLADSVVSELVATAADRDAPPRAEEADELAALARRPTYRVLYAERAPTKGPVGRTAEVAVYRYDTGRAVLARVDLTTGRVTAEDLSPEYPLPVVPGEIAEAAAVARQDGEVRAALKAAGLDPEDAAANGLLTGGVEEQSPCAVHRCVRLFFSSFRHPVPIFSVIVDLVSLEVVEIESLTTGGSNP